MEGGCIFLYGRRREANDWEFQVVADEPSFMKGGVFREFQWTNSWDQALKFLDSYPWVSLAPLVVHSEFRRKVALAVKQRWQKDFSEDHSADWDSAVGMRT